MISSINLNQPTPKLIMKPAVIDPSSGSFVETKKPVWNSATSNKPKLGGFNIGLTSPTTHTNKGLPFTGTDIAKRIK